MLPNGEVPSYLAGEARVGDQFEMGGPIGAPLVESVAWTLRDLGHGAKLIKTERFGPTGR